MEEFEDMRPNFALLSRWFAESENATVGPGFLQSSVGEWGLDFFSLTRRMEGGKASILCFRAEKDEHGNPLIRMREFKGDHATIVEGAQKWAHGM